MSLSINQFKTLFPQQAAELERAEMKKSKYGNVKTEFEGLKFDSKKEAAYYSKLALLQKSGIIVSIYPQPVFILQDSYVKDGKKIRAINYRADFMVEYKDGHTEVVDVKGYKNKVYELKKKMFHYKYPDLTIIEV